MQTFIKYVRSVKDSVLKLDPLSTQVAFDYGNVGVLRQIDQKTAFAVVFELQN
jgi:hypothetical protein